MNPGTLRSPQADAATPLFSVLTLDGGGARGYLTLKILERVETYLNTLTGAPLPLGARFDLICGTSTGGISALALALGRPVSEISALYETHLPHIFGSAMRRFAWLDNFRPSLPQQGAARGHAGLLRPAVAALRVLAVGSDPVVRQSEHP